MAKIERDGAYPAGTLLTIDSVPLPDHIWAPPDVYVEEGKYQVSYSQIIHTEVWGIRTVELGLSRITKPVKYWKMSRTVGRCNISLKGGVVYDTSDIIKLLDEQNCETQFRYPPDPVN